MCTFYKFVSGYKNFRTHVFRVDNNPDGREWQEEREVHKEGEDRQWRVRKVLFVRELTDEWEVRGQSDGREGGGGEVFEE